MLPHFNSHLRNPNNQVQFNGANPPAPPLVSLSLCLCMCVRACVRRRVRLYVCGWVLRVRARLFLGVFMCL